MNKNNVIQFIKDGLVGAIIAALIYLLLWLIGLFLVNNFLQVYIVQLMYVMLAFLFSMDAFGTFWSGSFSLFSPSSFFVIAIFVSTGLNTRFIQQNIPTRKDWAKPILKMLGIAWLVILPTALLFFVLSPFMGSLSRLSEHHNFQHSLSQAFSAVYGAVAEGFSSFVYPSVLHPASNTVYFYCFYTAGSIMGLLAGFVITYLAAKRFNPQKRWTRKFIPIIANFSIIAGIHLGVGISIMIMMMVFG